MQNFAQASFSGKVEGISFSLPFYILLLLTTIADSSGSASVAAAFRAERVLSLMSLMMSLVVSGAGFPKDCSSEHLHGFWGLCVPCLCPFVCPSSVLSLGTSAVDSFGTQLPSLPFCLSDPEFAHIKDRSAFSRTLRALDICWTLCLNVYI